MAEGRRAAVTAASPRSGDAEAVLPASSAGPLQADRARIAARLVHRAGRIIRSAFQV
jgi:hypothetical protein